MEQQLPENMKVLRLFGADQADLDALLAQAQVNKGVQMQQMQQGGETLLLLEAVTRSGAATLAVLNGWKEQITHKCGGALYGEGDTSLTAAMVDAFLGKKLLFACADAQTSALIESKLATNKHLESIYDYGANSHAHKKYARKIALGSKFASKYPDQTAQQVAGMVKVAYHYSGADCVLSILPFADQSHLIILGEKTHYYLRRVPAEQNALLWAVDMLRRVALQAAQATGTIRLAYGAAMPAFATVESIAEVRPEELTPAQAAFDAPPPPEPAARTGANIGFAVTLILFVALATILGLYLYTGGDIASLWESSGLNRYNVSSATLL